MGISPKAWWDVAEKSDTNGTELSMEIAKELRDRQRNSFAETTFSLAVEEELMKNGEISEAEWCRLIRNCYHGIDDGWVAVGQRIGWLLDMHAKLLSTLHIGHFPPQRAYYADLPICQFEGIMGNIDCRIQLYALAESGAYNQRAITSLDSGNIFWAFQVRYIKHSKVSNCDMSNKCIEDSSQFPSSPKYCHSIEVYWRDGLLMKKLFTENGFASVRAIHDASPCKQPWYLTPIILTATVYPYEQSLDTLQPKRKGLHFHDFACCICIFTFLSMVVVLLCFKFLSFVFPPRVQLTKIYKQMKTHYLSQRWPNLLTHAFWQESRAEDNLSLGCITIWIEILRAYTCFSRILIPRVQAFCGLMTSQLLFALLCAFSKQNLIQTGEQSIGNWIKNQDPKKRKLRSRQQILYQNSPALLCLKQSVGYIMWFFSGNSPSKLQRKQGCTEKSSLSVVSQTKRVIFHIWSRIKYV